MFRKRLIGQRGYPSANCPGFHRRTVSPSRPARRWRVRRRRQKAGSGARYPWSFHAPLDTSRARMGGTKGLSTSWVADVKAAWPARHGPVGPSLVAARSRTPRRARAAPAIPPSLASPAADGALHVRVEVRELALIAARHEWRRDDEVGGRAVACHGDVPDDRDPDERLHVGVVRLRLQRIPEEDEDVELALRDERADLLVAAERAALEPGDGQVELALEEGCNAPIRRDPASCCHGRRGRSVSSRRSLAPSILFLSCASGAATAAPVPRGRRASTLTACDT